MSDYLEISVGDEQAIAEQARFWGKVRVPRADSGPDVCWVWQGGLAPNGYGIFCGADGTSLGAHRFSWEINGGRSREGQYVCHKCDNRACVRPSHLFLGSAAENTADMVAKGRAVHKPRLLVPPAERKRIREIYASGGFSQAELGRQFGVSQGCIFDIVHEAGR